MNLCSNCKNDFTSVGAFDAHQRMTRDNEGVKCNVNVVFPKGNAHAGKPVLQAAGKRNGGTLYKFADHGQFAWAKGDAPAKDETRDCRDCGKPMRKKPGRGRWPVRCTVHGGTGMLV